jgi:hypothetical protein
VAARGPVGRGPAQAGEESAAYFIDTDGLSDALMLSGAVKDFTFAARVKGGACIDPFLMSPEPNVTYRSAWGRSKNYSRRARPTVERTACRRCSKA